MKIYEITFFVGNIPKFGGQLLASLYFTAFLKNPLRVVDAKKKTGSRWKCQDNFGVICSSSIYHIKTYISVSMIIYVSSFLAIYLPTYSIHPSIQTSIF